MRQKNDPILLNPFESSTIIEALTDYSNRALPFSAHQCNLDSNKSLSRPHRTRATGANSEHSFCGIGGSGRVNCLMHRKIHTDSENSQQRQNERKKKKRQFGSDHQRDVT